MPYLPDDLLTLSSILTSLGGVVIAGYFLGRFVPSGAARVVAWTTLVGGILVLDRVLSTEAAFTRMLLLVAFALLTMKVLVVVEERARGMKPLSFAAWLGFAGAWLGMRPSLFARIRNEPRPEAKSLVPRGLSRILIGLLLLVLARLLWGLTESRLLASVLLLSGMSLVLHFGVCNVMAGLWRRRGVPCDALFVAPLRSQNLGEFWGRRWNLAFSEMTNLTLYRPLRARLGRGPALMAGFALSGALHEMAISLPVRAGFGLPSSYFLLHGALMLVEDALRRAGYPLSGWLGRAWAIFWVVTPLPLLFHEPFMASIVWPLIGIPPK